MIFTMQNNHPPKKLLNKLKKKKTTKTTATDRGEMPSLFVSLAHWCRSEEEEAAVKHCGMILDPA